MKHPLKQLTFILLVASILPIHPLEIPSDFKAIQCDIRQKVSIRSDDHRNYFTHPLIPGPKIESDMRLPVRQSTSTNWAGYASVSNSVKPLINSVTSVSGTWIVPTITKSTGSTYCSIWVGIDGYSSGSVEQLGTEHDWSNGKQSHYAWFEMYPQYPYEITGFPVNPGDSISAAVVYMGNNVFVMTITNNTKKVYFAVPTTYTKSTTAQRSSAEWIVEAPFSTTVLPLSHFSTIAWSNCLTTISGLKGAINNNKWVSNALTMVTTTGAVKAAVSPLSTNGENFSVTWKHE